MQVGIGLGQNLKQEQRLTQQMIQSLKLLEVNSLELEAMIKEEVERNPLLEAEFVDDRGLKEGVSDKGNAKSKNTDEDSMRSAGEDKTKTDIDWDSYLKEGFDLGYRQTENLAVADPDDDFEMLPTYEKTMYDSLEEQLTDRRIKNSQLHQLVEYFIASLDENGFLTPTSSSAKKNQDQQESNLSVMVDEDVDENEKFSDLELKRASDDLIEGFIKLDETPFLVREALHILQSFDPPGIGARNLRESLLIQAYRRDDFSSIALQMIEKYFDLLINRKIPDLAKKMGRSPTEIQTAIEEITVLSPHPGKLLGGDSYSVVTPDISVLADENGVYKVTSNYYRQPTLKISKAYRDLLNNKKTDSKDIKFIKEKLNSANWLINALEQRKSTIEMVMERILDHQRDFFYKGPDHLKPLILDDIAREVEMHITTISRVTKGKYVQTPYGVYELKHFFTSSVKQDDGSEISNTKIKVAIKKMVDQEDPQKPLSDQKIADELKKNDLNVARRTVAKYREQIGILPARNRKKF